MIHLGTSNTSYGQQKGRKSNCQFDSWPLKVRNSPNFLMCRWCATYRWKVLDEGYNFFLDLISIEGLHAKLWAPKVIRFLVVGISGLPLEGPGTKWHLGVDLMGRHIVYYKGEGVGFSQVRAMVSLVNLSLHVVRPSTKSAPAMLSQPHFGQVWGWDSHSQKWELGVLQDSRNFRARQQREKHLALKCSLYRWKGLEV
jgi:hypothetical protein